MSERILNFDDSETKNRVLAGIRTMRGMWKFKAVRYRPKRTNPQNAYFHGVIIPTFVEWAKSEQLTNITSQKVKDMLKREFLSEEIVNAEGEIIGMTVLKTSSLDKAAMSVFIDQCIGFVKEWTGIDIPKP